MLALTKLLPKSYRRFALFQYLQARLLMMLSESLPKLGQPAIVPVAREDYFSTFIYKVNFPDATTLNAQLLPAIRQVKKEDTKKVERSNVVRLGGWHSHNNLHKVPEFKEVASRIESTAAVISEQLNYHPQYALQLTEMWSIINPPGGFNRNHIHSRRLWSGVYYIQAPKDCGSIKFTDPRTEHLMYAPKLKPQGPRSRKVWSTVEFNPSPGLLLLFPSWLYHSVNPNFVDDVGERAERVCISFNLDQFPI